MSATPMTYQWRRNGLELTGATGSSLTITNAQVEHEGIYTVVVRDGVAVFLAPGGMPIWFDHDSVLRIVGAGSEVEA